MLRERQRSLPGSLAGEYNEAVDASLAGGALRPRKEAPGRWVHLAPLPAGSLAARNNTPPWDTPKSRPHPPAPSGSQETPVGNLGLCVGVERVVLAGHPRFEVECVLCLIWILQASALRGGQARLLSHMPPCRTPGQERVMFGC